MRNLTIALILLATAGPATASSSTYVDPQLRWLMQQPETAGPAIRPLHAPALGINNGQSVRILATGDELAVAQKIGLLGGKVLGYHKGAVHAELTPGQLRLLAQDAEVEGLQPSRKLKPSLDVSRVQIHADAVQQGAGIDQPYTGQGVIIGIVDTGIDIAHPDFLNSDGSTRIVSLWDQTIDFENGQQRPIGFNYGVECTAEHINAYLQGADPLESCPTDDGRPIDGFPSEGHGSHVAGIAASSDDVYTGIAPAASIIAVRAHFEEGSILDGVDYVLSKCEEYQRPCVINLSLGTTAGAHDGSALIETMLAEKTGPGRIIVAAAGNEANHPDNNSFGHASIQLANTLGLKKGAIVFPNTDYSGNDDYSLLLDVWGSDASVDSFYIAPAELTGNQSGAPLAVQSTFADPGSYITPPENGDTTSHKLTFNSKAYAWVHISSPLNPVNNRRETIIAIDRCADPCALGGTIDDSIVSFSSRVFLVNVRDAGNRRLDLWPMNTSATFFGEATLTFDWPGLAETSHTFTGGDNESTVTIPATSDKVIAVGSYITKTSWTSFTGSKQDYDGSIGALSQFSSLGPATDGRIKPDVAAPGEWIASTHSTRDSELPRIWKPDDLHVHLLGTSMASPHVAGLVALVLEKNPTLAPADLVGENGLLTRNTQTTDFTGTLPNISFGYGAIDALAVFQDPAFVAAPDADGAAPAIKNIRVSSSGSRATIRWTTNEPSTSAVVLEPVGGGSEKRASRKSYSQKHEIELKGLGSEEYRVRVIATDLAGNTKEASGPNVKVEACGCSSRQGPSPWDALPLLGVAGFWVFLRRRSR